VEHWFDALSRPQSRRTVLKGAAVAGVALVVPGVRVPRASATEREPCFVPCEQAATDRWLKGADNCAARTYMLVGQGTASLLYGGLALAGLFTFAAAAGAASCMSSAELDFHRDSLACRGSECGDGSKYPGGAAQKPPPPKCDPIREKVCGDICCNVITDCCLSAKTGRYLCYAAGHNCEGA
jgi:hypothetical protein